MSLSARLENLRRSGWAGFVFGLAAFLSALAVREALGATLSAPSFGLFLPAVILTTFVGGLWPGLLVATAGCLTGWLDLPMSPGSSATDTAGGWLMLGLYTVNAGLVIALIHAMHVTQDRLRAERRAAADMLALRQTLFQELQHRVSNSIQFVASLVRLQRRQVENDPTRVRLLMDETLSRLNIIARIHRRLYDANHPGSAFPDLLRELCQDVLAATGTRGITCLVESGAVTLSHEKAVCLSLIVTETLINALKHAFPGGGPGTIRIAIERSGETHYVLDIRDDGDGPPEGFDPAESEGFGMRIIRGLAHQLGGEVTLSREGGLHTRVVFEA